MDASNDYQPLTACLQRIRELRAARATVVEIEQEIASARTLWSTLSALGRLGATVAFSLEGTRDIADEIGCRLTEPGPDELRAQFTAKLEEIVQLSIDDAGDVVLANAIESLREKWQRFPDDQQALIYESWSDVLRGMASEFGLMPRSGSGSGAVAGRYANVTVGSVLADREASSRREEILDRVFVALSARDDVDSPFPFCHAGRLIVQGSVRDQAAMVEVVRLIAQLAPDLPFENRLVIGMPQ